LKHLAVFGGGTDISSSRLLYLIQSSPTLLSLTTELLKVSSLPRAILESNSFAILFHAYPTGISRSPSLDVKHLFIMLSNNQSSPNRVHLDNAQAGLQSWTNFILNSNSRLKTVHLALRTGGGGVHSELQAAVAGLVAACKISPIRVIWDEWEEELTFNHLVPTSFIREVEARQGGDRVLNT
jgi:hypothetical protein